MRITINITIQPHIGVAGFRAFVEIDGSGLSADGATEAEAIGNAVLEFARRGFLDIKELTS